MKQFIFFIICILISKSVQAVILPSPQLSEKDIQDYKSKSNNFKNHFCRNFENTISEKVNVFMDNPSDAAFENLIKNSFIKKSDFIILTDYLNRSQGSKTNIKWQKIIRSLEQMEEKCEESEFLILGFTISTDGFDKFLKNNLDYIKKENIDIKAIKFFDQKIPAEISINKHLKAEDLVGQSHAEYFFSGDCTAQQINSHLYKYIDYNEKIEFDFGSSCSYLSNSMNTEIKKTEIWKNKYLWFGVALLAGGYLLSKNGKELVIEY